MPDFLEIKSVIGATASRQDLPADDFVWVIGRQEGADVLLPSSGISRRHAILSRTSGVYALEDANSMAGTLVNGNKITARVNLKVGDSIGIGEFELMLRSVVEKNKANGNVHSPTPKSSPPGDLDFIEEFKDASLLYTPDVMVLAKRIHEDLLEKMHLSEGSIKDITSGEEREKLERTLDQSIREHRHEIPSRIPLALFRQALLDEVIDLGPIASLIRSPRISEIMVNGPNIVFVESRGKIFDSGVKFFDDAHLLKVIHRIVEPLGRHIDDASPMVDARLADGSRVNAVIAPLSLKGAALTIRKFSDKKLTTDDLIGFGSMTREMALFLEEAVKSRKNILVSGGTGSGKTTLLNVLSLFIPQGERVITIEDSAELKLTHRNLVTLEARPANIEGKGRISIRDLVINTLRMRPDRIIVGECRGPEALDMLQAMNTGHDGSLTTAHANTPRDALSRLENMVLMAGMELPSSAIREQIASAIDIVVQQTRLLDGSRKVVKITEVTGREGNQILMQDIFTFEQTGISPDGTVEGYHTATGNIPVFIDDLRKSGRLELDMSVFVPKV